MVPGELGLKLALIGLSHALTGGGGAGPEVSDTEVNTVDNFLSK